MCRARSVASSARTSSGARCAIEYSQAYILAYILAYIPNIDSPEIKPSQNLVFISLYWDLRVIRQEMTDG